MFVPTSFVNLSNYARAKQARKLMHLPPHGFDLQVFSCTYVRTGHATSTCVTDMTSCGRDLRPRYVEGGTVCGYIMADCCT